MMPQEKMQVEIYMWGGTMRYLIIVSMHKVVIDPSNELKIKRDLHQSHPFEYDIGDIERFQQPFILAATQFQFIL